MSDAMAFNNFENLKIPTITTLGKAKQITHFSQFHSFYNTIGIKFKIYMFVLMFHFLKKVIDF